jgi:MUN domain
MEYSLLSRLTGKARRIGFEFKSIFAPYVEKWLRETDLTTLEWVDRAVKADEFKPENEELKQSTSVMDIFSVINNATDFLRNLQWPDEVQSATFMKNLSKVFVLACLKK